MQCCINSSNHSTSAWPEEIIYAFLKIVFNSSYTGVKWKNRGINKAISIDCLKKILTSSWTDHDLIWVHILKLLVFKSCHLWRYITLISLVRFIEAQKLPFPFRYGWVILANWSRPISFNSIYYIYYWVKKIKKYDS